MCCLPINCDPINLRQTHKQQNITKVLHGTMCNIYFIFCALFEPGLNLSVTVKWS